MPNLSALRGRQALEIYTVITAGPMAPHARHLSHHQRRAITEFTTGKILGESAVGAAAIPQASFCKQPPNGVVRNLDSGWNGWGNDLENSRYQGPQRAGLKAADVARLEVKWTFGVPAVETMSGQATIVDGRVFFGTISGLVIALDAESGCTLWAFEAQAGVRTSVVLGKLADNSVRLFFGDLAGNVYAVDPDTGEQHWRMLADDHPHARITGTPVYHGNRLFVPLASLEEVAGAMPDYECCTFRGGLVSVDAVSGATNWKRHTIDQAPSRQAKNKLGVQRWAPSGAAIGAGPTVAPDPNRV